jgi:CheY-like chemotaxis protein
VICPVAGAKPAEPPPATEAATAQELVQLRQELVATREYLQSMVEQQDAANEELRSLATAPREPIAKAGPGAPQDTPTTSRRILVVDDNRDQVESLAILLRLMGHEVRVAENGPQTLQAAAEFAPEVFLLDIGLPGLNGYEVARRIREQPKLRSALIIAQTGWGQEDDRRRSHEAGFDYHLVKPVSLDAIEKILRDLPRKE